MTWWWGSRSGVQEGGGQELGSTVWESARCRGTRVGVRDHWRVQVRRVWAAGSAGFRGGEVRGSRACRESGDPGRGVRGWWRGPRIRGVGARGPRAVEAARSGAREQRGGLRRAVGAAGAGARESLPLGLRRVRGRGPRLAGSGRAPQRRGAGPRSGPRSLFECGSGARSGPLFRSRAAGLRMLARAVPAARAPGSPVSQRRPRPALTPGVREAAPTAQAPVGRAA